MGEPLKVYRAAQAMEEALNVYRAAQVLGTSPIGVYKLVSQSLNNFFGVFLA